MKYVLNVLVGIDQLGNALGGGHHDNTVSARVGYFAEHANIGRICWRMLESIINFAFYPLDGPDHCKNAYLKDSDEDFQEGRTIPYIFLSLLILITTPFIGLLLHIVVFFFPHLGWEYKNKNKTDESEN